MRCDQTAAWQALQAHAADFKGFDLREAFARRLGRKWLAFCSVKRPDDHPMRPVTYRTNDAFWRGRGYTPLPGVEAEFSWKDVGEAGETTKRLQFWMRAL